MESRTSPQSNPRSLVWVSEHAFHGWTCSQCEWNFPLPTLLNDPEAKTAYDRLAAGKFRDHRCENFPSRFAPPNPNSSTVRIRKLIAQGFKPKDAVDLFLQEISLEYPDNPKMVAQAKTDAEDFLRRLRSGLI